MIDNHADVAAQPTLRSRAPAYSVMQECLRIQATAPPQSAAAKLFGQNPLHPEARSWYRGAIGEIDVAEVLSKLGPEWTVLHAVPVGSGSSDIDHVVIGPAGVFTINTKNHTGKIFVAGGTLSVNGHKTDHIRNSLHEAGRASRLLSIAAGTPVRVTPLIVLVSTEPIKKGRTKPKVTVLPSNWLSRWLKRRPRILSEQSIECYAKLAEQRGTWHAQPVVFYDTLRHVQRFQRLQHEIALARQRNRTWIAMATLLPIAIAIVLIAVLPGAIMAGLNH